MNKIQDYVNTFNLKHDDGVILALIPIQDSVPDQIEVGGKMFYAWDGVMVDSTTPVRWWQLRAAAKEAKYAHPSQLWAGPVSEAEVQYARLIEEHPYFQRLNEHQHLAIRAFNHGPWMPL